MRQFVEIVKLYMPGYNDITTGVGCESEMFWDGGRQRARGPELFWLAPVTN